MNEKDCNPLPNLVVEVVFDHWDIAVVQQFHIGCTRCANLAMRPIVTFWVCSWLTPKFWLFLLSSYIHYITYDLSLTIVLLALVLLQLFFLLVILFKLICISFSTILLKNHSSRLSLITICVVDISSKPKKY